MNDLTNRDRTFDTGVDPSDFWSLTDRQLAQACLILAEARLPAAHRFMGAEAMRLYQLWRGAMNADRRSRADTEEIAGMLAALRKRTIQILVRLSLPVPRPDALPALCMSDSSHRSHAAQRRNPD